MEKYRERKALSESELPAQFTGDIMQGRRGGVREPRCNPVLPAEYKMPNIQPGPGILPAGEFPAADERLSGKRPNPDIVSK